MLNGCRDAVKRRDRHNRRDIVAAFDLREPPSVEASSTGNTLLIEWSVVTPGSGGSAIGHVQSVRFGRLTQGDVDWTFTPLPAPAVYAAGGGAPSIAW